MTVVTAPTAAAVADRSSACSHVSPRMSSLASSPASERFARGQALLREVAGPEGPALLDGLDGIAPDLARLTVEFGYGDVYGRPGLSLTQRQLINVAALTALGTAAPQLRFHVDGALNVGVAPAGIVETVLHVAVYAGIPAALNGMAVVKAAFAARPDLDFSPARSGTDGAETLRERHERGLAALDRIDGEAGERVVASLADIAPVLADYVVDFAFADVYSRPALGLRTRELATVAACTALGTAGPQLRVHLHGLLNVGGTRDEAVEAIIQMAVYAGFPAALNGITAAREVFAERDAAGLAGA
ncbi:carboxymuconolactone decarboxylase family protein [Kitasatospora sp. NPDC048194]|uniref:carboxymuconolactone decarboxylase family protein n=1 Tax=Kitasatospora sp. NPDC048194 TaxID=3364045 RepID=UPI00371A9220